MTATPRKDKDLDNEGQFIIEEKIVKVNGEMTYRKFVKGRFLGKVTPLTF